MHARPLARFFLVHFFFFLSVTLLSHSFCLSAKVASQALLPDSKSARDKSTQGADGGGEVGGRSGEGGGGGVGGGGVGGGSEGGGGVGVGAAGGGGVGGGGVGGGAEGGGGVGVGAEGGGGVGGGGEGGEGDTLAPVQVFLQGRFLSQAEGRANSRKHEVGSGQPEVGAPLALLKAHLGFPFAS